MTSAKHILVGVLLLMAISAAQASDEDELDAFANTLTGSWGGLRPAWSKSGLAVDLGYRWDMLRNQHGGIRRGGRPMGQFDLRLKGDMDKLVGWKGGTAYVNVIYDGGGKTNRDFVGSLMGVTSVEVPVSTHRVFHGWIEHSFDEANAWSLLAGLYPIDSEFQVLDTAGLFVQPPYGPTADLSLTRGPSIFNQSAFGLRAKWQSKDQKVYLMGAVLDGIPGDPQRPRGTHIKFNKGDGTMQIIEIGARPRMTDPNSDTATLGTGDEDNEPASEAIEKYALGYWRYTSKVDDLIDVDALGNPERRRSSGWYALAERTMLNWKGGDLATFLRVSKTDGDSTAISHTYSLGLRFKGIVPGRQDDLFGMAHTYSATSSKWRASQAIAGTNAVGHESATEVTYRMQANKWLAVQPLFQLIRFPGAISTVPKATIVGVRVDVAL